MTCVTLREYRLNETLRVTRANTVILGLGLATLIQQYQTTWNGNGGRTYFYQNEMPYDPPNQASWMNGSTRGYAAYKVANPVTSHEAWGLGSYCYFNVNTKSGAQIRNLLALAVPTPASRRSSEK